MLTHKHIIFSQTDQYNKEYTITEPEDVSADNSEHTPQTKSKKPKQKKTQPTEFEQIDETAEVEGGSEEPKDRVQKKRKVKADQEKLTEDSLEQVLGSVEKKEKPKKKKLVKSKKDELDDYIQFLIHQEIPKTVLTPYTRTEMELPQRARRDSSIKPMKLTAIKIEKIEVKKPKMVEISSVVEFPQMLKLKTPKQRPEEKKRRTSEASFKNKKLKSVIRFIPYAPYCFPYTVVDLETNRDNGELSRNIEEAEEVLKLKPRKFKHSKPVKTELEKPDLEELDDENTPQEEDQVKPKYKRLKKKKDETEEENKKLKIGKGKIPQNVENIEEIQLKPFEVDSQSEDIIEKPKEAVERKDIKKKTKKRKETDDSLSFEPLQDDDEIEETESKPAFKYELIELESEEIPDKLFEESVKPLKEPKKKRVLKLNTELEENIIEIVEVSAKGSDDKVYEVVVTNSEVEDHSRKGKKILKKKVKRMNKDELDGFVAELEENPDQTFYETTVNDFYEVKLSELETEEIPGEKPTEKIKKRRILHTRGENEEIVEIVESTPKAGEETLYEVTIRSIEPEDIGTTIQEADDKPKTRKTKKMKKDDLDAYIQHLINAEIPVTELEKYEKTDIDVKRKKIKKQKSKPTEPPIDEGEAFEVGITHKEPTKKPKVKKPKLESKVEEESVLQPESIVDHDEYNISTIESQRISEDYSKDENIPEVLNVDEIITDITETLPFVIVEEYSENVPESVEDEEKPDQKTIKKRKIKTRKGSKQYEIQIVETDKPDDDLDEAKVIVITTEAIEESQDEPNLQNEIIPKKIVKKVKKDKLKEYIVSVIDEAPMEVLEKISEDISTEMDTTTLDDDNFNTFKTTVVDDDFDAEEIPEKELVETPTDMPKTKKHKLVKPKKVKITEELPNQFVEDDTQDNNPIEIVESDTVPEQDNYVANVTETEPKPKKKPTKKQPKEAKSTPVSEYVIRIEELEPETVTEEVINEQGESVEKITTKRKLKKKDGNKEYLIEVVETYEQNQPEAELVIKTTEIIPDSDLEGPKEHKVKIVKKKKPKAETLDNYIQQLIEDEIPKVELERYETTITESIPEEKKAKRIKKLHKKTTELVDGIPQIIHEFTIQEFEPEKEEPVPEFISEIKEIDSVKPLEDFEIKDEEQVKPEPKPKKPKKSKIAVIDQEPVSIKDIEETVEVKQEVEEDGSTKEVQVKKRKILRKQGPKEHIFEITETIREDEPLSEVTITEITETEKPSEELQQPEEIKKPIKKSKKLKRADVENYVINIVEEFVEPTKEEIITQEEETAADEIVEVTEEDDIPKAPKTKTIKQKKTIKKPEDHTIRIEELAPETTIERIVNKEGEEVKQVKTTKKLKKKEGPKEYLIEITETYQENKPVADIEVITTELVPEDLSTKEEEQPTKIIQKVKKKKPVKDDLDKYIQQLIEQEITKTDLEQYEPTEMETKPKQPKKKTKHHHKKTVEIVDGLPVTVHEFNVSEVEPELTEEEYQPILSETESLPSETEEPSKYSVKVSDEFVEPTQYPEESTETPTKPAKKKRAPQQKQVEKAPIVLDEIVETVEVVQEPTEDGTVKEVTVKKRRVKHRRGSKQSVFEITETSSDDQPMAEVVVVELPAIESELSEEQPSIEKKPIKKVKKVKKDDIQEYVINVIDELVHETPLEIVEEEVVETKEDKPRKPKKAPKDYKISEEETVQVMKPETPLDIFEEPLDENVEATEEFSDFTIDIKEEIPADQNKQKKPKIQTKSKVERQPEQDKLQEYQINVSSTEPIEKAESPEPESFVPEEEVEQTTDEPIFQIEEIETKTDVSEEKDDNGETTQKIVKKRKIKKQVGPKEELIEIVETVKDGVPEFEVTVITEESTPELKEIPQDEKPKKVKKSKKVPKDDLHDYIQKLIEQDIPKSELEKYEKIDFDEPVKMKKKPVKKIKVIEEQPDDTLEVTVAESPEIETKLSESLVEDTALLVTVKEFSPEAPEETPFEITVLEEFVENKPLADETGEIKVKEVKIKKIKQKKGPKEVIHEITVVRDEDGDESEITIVTTSPKESDIPQNVVKKEKKIKKVKKDDVDDFIQSVIEEDSPKDTVEHDDINVVEEMPKQPSEKSKKTKKKEKAPLDKQPSEIDDNVQIVEDIPKDEPIVEDTVQLEKIAPSIDKPEEDIIETEIKTPQKKKKPIKEKVQITEEQPEEEHFDKPMDVVEKEADIEQPDETEYNVSYTEEEPKPQEKIKQSPKKVAHKTSQPVESSYEVSVKESVVEPIDQFPMEVEVVESETKAEETTDDAGEVHKVVTTKRKIKRPKGDYDEVIEIIEVVTDDQPDALITVVEYEPEIPQKDEKPKEPKKKTKKIKKDDIHDYIQKLIDMETPKTELEKYEKIEFESSPKEKPSESAPVKVTEESTLEKPKKDKKTKPKDVPKKEEITPEPLAEVRITEIEGVEEPKVVEVIEVQPEEVEITEKISEEGLPVQEKTTKRVLKKKSPEEQKTFKITTIESDDKDTVTVIVDEEPEDVIPVDVTESQPEETVPKTPKPKPKKTVKKIKKDDLDDYVQKLLEEEIPKVELEKYEKVDMPNEPKKKVTEELVPDEVKLDEPDFAVTELDSTKPKKTKTHKPKPVDTIEQIQDEPTETVVDTETEDIAEVTPKQLAHPEDTATAQITPSAQDENSTQDDTKDTIQKTVKHKKAKPDTVKSVETSKLLAESLWSLTKFPTHMLHLFSFAPLVCVFRL